MFDEKTLSESQEAEARWRAAFDRLGERMESNGRPSATQSGLPLALRVQQVIQEETNVQAVSDPLAGSYYVEALTDQIAKAALAVVEKVEAQGGYVAAQQKGWIRAEVERSAARWRELVDEGKRRIVGLNCYEGGDEAEPEIFEVSEDVEQIAMSECASFGQRAIASASSEPWSISSWQLSPSPRESCLSWERTV